MYTDKNYKVCSLHINIPLKFEYLYIQKNKRGALNVRVYIDLLCSDGCCVCVERKAQISAVARRAAGKIDEHGYLF